MSNGSRTRKRRYCYFATLLVTFKLSASGFNNESGIGNLGSGIIEHHFFFKMFFHRSSKQHLFYPFLPPFYFLLFWKNIDYKQF